VDRKAESVRKLNRDAACELYHSLILLALGLPHRCWRKNPTNVVAITYITQVVFVYLVRRFLNFLVRLMNSDTEFSVEYMS
jgi:hypothetical protein